MLKKVVCPICGTEFETQKPNKKYCSLSCREASRVIKRKLWEAKNPDYFTTYIRQYRERKRNEKVREQDTNSTGC